MNLKVLKRVRNVLFALGTLGLLFVACRRRIVTRPAVTVVVVDSEGKPVAGADVVLFWLSRPGQKHHETTRFTADASGTITLTEKKQGEIIMPLCMHGVPGHYFELCAGARGYAHRMTELRSGQKLLTFTLEKGVYDGECADLRRAQGRP